MNVSFKQTIWEDFKIPEHLEDEVREKIKSETITNSDELFNFLKEEKGEEPDNEKSLESAEDMDVVENGHCSTVELREEGSTFPDWGNGDEVNYDG